MKYKFNKTVVVALGGSIVHPDEIDTNYLKDLKKFVAPLTKKGMKFVFVIGGGALARRFQNAAAAVAHVTDDDKDWIGIHATRLNAHLLRTVFRDVADPVVIDARGRVKVLMHPITIAAGWRPGWSTDYVAAQIAADFGARAYIIAGKPAFVYSGDPSVIKGAKPLLGLSWKEYRKMIPAKWIPGFHAPVDPIAAKLSDERGLRAVIINGKDLGNFRDLLNGKEFQGTIVG
jgi:uridylate kinase